MDYKIVELAEKTVVGITAQTNNFSNEMSAVIGGTWQRFFNEAYSKILDKANPYTLGIYTDYSSESLFSIFRSTVFTHLSAPYLGNFS